MARLVVSTFVTMDGVMQAPGTPEEDRSDGFEHGGWQVPYVDDDHLRYVSDLITAAGGFLLGRATYEGFAAHWPRVGEDHEHHEIAAALNGLPKYVVSTTLTELTWNNSTLISGNVAAEVAELKRKPGKEIQVHGSWGLIQTLRKHDLVDEYRVWIYPVVLGSGKRLFPEGTAPGALRLVDTKMTRSGAVLHVYHPAGAVQHGSFALSG